MDLIKKIYGHYFRQNRVTIISNDCWGGQFYRHLGLEYSTPFVGLYLYAPCFIEFVSNFDFYIKSGHFKQIHESRYKEANEYRNSNNRTYPIGLLNNKVEIHFLHYKNWNDATEKWESRKSRINFNNLVFKFDGSKDLATPELTALFENLSFEKKIVIQKGSIDHSRGVKLFIPNWQIDGAKMYKVSLQYFDVLVWIKTGNVRNTLINKFWYKYFVKDNSGLL